MLKHKCALLVVEPASKAMDRFANVLKNPTKTKDKYRDYIILSFPSFETLGRVITGARLELLSVIRIRKPKSIQELARMVRRDFKNVYQDVKLLNQYGLIDLKENGARKASHPVAKFTELLFAA